MATLEEIPIPSITTDVDEDVSAMNESDLLSPHHDNNGNEIVFGQPGVNSRRSDNDNSSLAYTSSTGTGSHASSLHQQNSGRLVSNLTSESIMISSEQQMDLDTQRRHLIETYQTCEPYPYNKETLASIGKIVRQVLVKKVKFIEHEHTSGMSRQMIDKTRIFPSFWQPDLTQQNNIQSDLFREFEELQRSSLKTKAIAWMGMRRKVLKSIREHRNTVCTAIQQDMIAGKYYFYLYYS